MAFPLDLSLAPMEARSVAALPTGAGWQYEPKWDGFRCLAHRDAAQVELRSKSGQPLGRYFPDVVAALPCARFVLDGELVVPVAGVLSFEELQLRLHPAASRVAKLAAAHPAVLVVFDLLAGTKGEPLLARPLAERRAALEEFAAECLDGQPGVRLSPATHDVDVARDWFARTGDGLDGIVAKRLDRPYRPGDRTGMLKVKNVRTADCVVGGFRYASAGGVVGSLLLGLYDDQGLLHHVGFTSGLREAERRDLTPALEGLVEPPGFTGRAPGGPSRWSTQRSGDWKPLKPRLVVEVSYDHVTGGRFRHGTALLRWRPDKAPRQCTLDQLSPPPASALDLAG